MREITKNRHLLQYSKLKISLSAHLFSTSGQANAHLCVSTLSSGVTTGMPSAGAALLTPVCKFESQLYHFVCRWHCTVSNFSVTFSSPVGQD